MSASHRPWWLFALAFSLVLAGCQAVPAQSPTPVPATATPLPPTATLQPPTATPAPEPVLEITAPGGSKLLTLADLMQLPITEGEAGFKSSTGKITPPLPHRGVALRDLVTLLGPLDDTMGVNVVAKDGYGITYSYEQIINGSFTAYDPATGDELKDPVGLTPMLAFEREGKPLPEDADGTLRMVIVSPKRDQVTDGHWSVKWVTKLEIKALVADWTVTLDGALTEKVDRATFESCVQCHKSTWTDDKAQEWAGTPLYLLAGYVDDEIKHQGPAFNDAVAEAGYVIELTAVDGYTVTIDSARAARNDDLLVASLVNGNPLPDQYFPLRLVGPELGKKELVGALAEITLDFDELPATLEPTPVPPTPEPAAAIPPGIKGDIVLVGAVQNALGYVEADLRALEVVKVKAEHPKRGVEDYEGVRLSTLLAKAAPQAAVTTMVLVAADDFTAEVELSAVLACADCLVAFTETPGKLKMVMPGMASNVWVKDIVKIEFK